MPPKPEPTELQPGADRFWGQFSQSKAGRSGSDQEAENGPKSGSGGGGEAAADHCLEWCPICRSAELFKTAVSPELRQQAESIQHEAVGVLKAFLDAYADKTGGEPGQAAPGKQEAADPAGPDDPAAPRVTDIPLD